ncbi:MAG: hypothetical protein M3285_12910 [Actinomycetota bacterium]|nr:hypothetical protein [Actinomycetota bacterium]
MAEGAWAATTRSSGGHSADRISALLSALENDVFISRRAPASIHCTRAVGGG